MAKPTVGRIVHYYPTDHEVDSLQPCAAIVTRVWSDRTVDLFALDLGTKIPFAVVTSATQSDTPEAERWMWPPRS